LIKSFQSKEVKETISSLLDNFISGKTTLRRKDNQKWSDCDSEDIEEEDYFEKENTNGDRKKVYKKKETKNKLD